MARAKTPKKTIELNETAAKPISAAGNGAAAAAVKEPEAKIAKPRRAMKSPDVMDRDARAALLPTNVNDEIRQLAYLFSERRGFEPGHETEDWLAAESEVLQRYHMHSA